MSVLFDLQNGKDFTSAEHAVAGYILAHSEQIADMSIADLARETHTSNASIIRLCHKVGARGFRDFRLSFLRELARVPDDSGKTDLNYPVYDRSSPVIVMKSMADVQKYALNACYTGLSALDIQKAAFLIHGSRHIYLYGSGESMLVARMFARRLARIGYICVIIEPSEESLAYTRTAEAGDTAVIISYSGSGIFAYKQAFSLFAEKKMHSILITANRNLKNFECVICYPDGESPDDNAATFYSTEASMYVTNCIYSLLFAMDYQAAREEKQETDNRSRGQIRDLL